MADANETSGLTSPLYTTKDLQQLYVLHTPPRPAEMLLACSVPPQAIFGAPLQNCDSFTTFSLHGHSNLVDIGGFRILPPPLLRTLIFFQDPSKFPTIPLV
jgi:hypothetical protein